MRRIASVILFILGGWLLCSETVMAWINAGQGLIGLLDIAAFMAVLAIPFLFFGMWASPGNRLADIGLTLMLAAGAGAACALIMALVFSDPGFKQLMPPDKPMPDVHFAYVIGSANTVILGGGGWLLWWFGKSRERANKVNLEQVFGD